MRKSFLGSLLVGTLAVVLPAACSNPPATAPSVSFTSPVAAQPSNGVSYKFKEQPVTLAISNVIRTAPAATTYSVEVSTDAGFGTKTFTKDSIAEGSGGTTNITLASLPGNTTYYWRWHAVVDGVTSQSTNGQSFVIQQQIIINTPTPTLPAAGITTTEPRPTFTVKNATHQGAVGTISYLFQVSTSSSFSPLVASATVTEQSGGQTSWTPAADLPSTTVYWRVQASDPSNTETGPFSTTSSFLVQPFSLKRAEIINNPQDLADWDEVTKITSVDFSTGYMMVDFDERLTGRWPESGFGVEYTLGMCFYINARWHCSAVIQFWTGRDLEASGPAGDIHENWYYGRWGVMDGYQPAIGELVGIFVAQGNLRDNSGESVLHERSNVLLIPFGENFVLR